MSEVAIQGLARVLFKQLWTATAFNARQLERKTELQGAKVRLLNEPTGPAYEESLEGVTLRLWASVDGPRAAFFDTNILGFIWARISTEAADRCIGALVGTVIGPQWIARRRDLGDLCEDGIVICADSLSRPGTERFMEVRQMFIVAAAARWAGREIDKYQGGDCG